MRETSYRKKLLVLQYTNIDKVKIFCVLQDKVALPNANLNSENCYFLKKYDGLSQSVAFAQNRGILQSRIDQRAEGGGGHKKMNFDHFQI